MKRIQSVACLLLCLSFASCVVRVGDDGITWFGSGSNSRTVSVDGVRLDEQHEETLDISAWDANGLAVETGLGDLTVKPTDGPNRIVVIVHEKTAGDAWAHYADGRLTAQSKSGAPSAIGEVTVFVRDTLPTLTLGTGLGDVDVRGVAIAGRTDLSTGTGDIDLVDLQLSGPLTLSTGRGDVDVRDALCSDVLASTGLGDIDVQRVQAGEASFSSGLGDVEVEASTFDYLVADTGLGHVDCSKSSYRDGKLDSGLGRVRR